MYLQERCCKYWPTDRSAKYQYYVVDPVSEQDFTTYVIRDFKVKDAMVSCRKVKKKIMVIMVVMVTTMMLMMMMMLMTMTMTMTMMMMMMMMMMIMIMIMIMMTMMLVTMIMRMNNDIDGGGEDDPVSLTAASSGNMSFNAPQCHLIVNGRSSLELR